MPRFEPFPGLRYSTAHVGPLDAVVCPPYDVIAEEERRALLARSPYNAVRIELPVDGDPDPYTAAAALLDAWRDGGVVARDHQPAFYGHRMRWRDAGGAERRSVGVIGALALEPPGHGILPHEETTPKARTDRLELLRATRLNVSPIWALTPRPGLAALAGEPAHPAEHAGAEGVVHELWPITDPAAVAAIRDHVGAEPVLVADGHHRYEVALAHRAERGGAGDHDAVMALVVELDDDQLTVQPIHRLVGGVAAGEVLAALGRHFELTPTDPPDAGIEARMARAGSLAVVTAGGTWLARPLPATVAAATHDLDSSRLDVALADLAGSGAGSGAGVTYQHGWDRVATAVGEGAAAAGVLLRPATTAQIAAISRGGVRMPAKTTFFWPKPRTGLVMRELVG